MGQPHVELHSVKPLRVRGVDREVRDGTPWYSAMRRVTARYGKARSDESFGFLDEVHMCAR